MKVIQADITTIERGVLLNGVNCQRVMGSGVAKAYFEKWPQVREAYMRIPKDVMELGIVRPVVIQRGVLYVVNCWTQDRFGREGIKYASPTAVFTCVHKVRQFAESRKLDVYTPKIGAGLGGLDWDTEVVPSLEGAMKGSSVELIVCEYEP